MDEWTGKREDKNGYVVSNLVNGLLLSPLYVSRHAFSLVFCVELTDGSQQEERIQNNVKKKTENLISDEKE